MLGAFALFLFSFGCVEAQDVSKVSLRSVSYGGTGCPQGSEIASYSNGTRYLLPFPSPPSQYPIHPIPSTSSTHPIHPTLSTLQIGIALTSTPHRTVFVFSPLAAFIGPLWTAAERRENCQISLDFAYPKGLQYTLASAAFKGTVDLDRGVTATVGTVVYFSGGGLFPLPFPFPILPFLSSQ